MEICHEMPCLSVFWVQVEIVKIILLCFGMGWENLRMRTDIHFRTSHFHFQHLATLKILFFPSISPFSNRLQSQLCFLLLFYLFHLIWARYTISLTISKFSWYPFSQLGFQELASFLISPPGLPFLRKSVTMEQATLQLCRIQSQWG